MSKEPERWHLSQNGHEHTVEISTKATARVLRWTTDGTEVVRKKTSENTVVLDGKEHGAVRLKLPSLTGPARQVTLYTSENPEKEVKAAGAAGKAHLGVGGTDFVPEEGSKAAKREAWIRDHPHQFAARRTATAVGGVLFPIGALWLLQRITWRPDIDLPDVNLPDLPDLPKIPWPQIDLPNIDLPWPDIDLPDLPNLPGWVQYVFPVLIAFGVAQTELRRRRQQDEKRKAAAAAQNTADPKAAKQNEAETEAEERTVPKAKDVLKPAKFKKPLPEDDGKTTQACRVPNYKDAKKRSTAS